jgi:hypothetical protein
MLLSFAASISEYIAAAHRPRQQSGRTDLDRGVDVQTGGAPKQRLAALRHLLIWLVNGQS